MKSGNHFSPPNKRGKTKFTKNLFNDNQPAFRKATHRFCKQVLWIHRKGSNYGYRSELGPLTLSLNIYCRLLKYWFRLVSSDSKRVVSKALLANNMLFQRDRSCWLTTINFPLNIIGKNTADYRYLDEKEIISKVRNTLTLVAIEKYQATLLANKTLDLQA